ncbi:MAG: xanthine dehydrogenase family protein molybdopterin-binding subunit, partial [Burkholderiaceae bacterium]
MSSSPQASADAAGVPNRFGSGQAVHRIEDPALLTGQGRFTDNVPVDGQTYLAFVRSPYAHARILGIDTAAARALPGVLAVYTGAELAAAGVQPIPTNPMFKRADGKTTVTPPRRALAHERARFVGEAVAAVVATSRTLARDAAEAVVV